MDGVVVSCKNIAHGDDSLYSYLIVYAVNGREYQINRTDGFNPGKAGRRIPVRYASEDPSNCTCRGDGGFLIAILLIIIGVMLLPGPLCRILHP